MANTAEELYTSSYDNFLNVDSLSQSTSITSNNIDAIVGDGVINSTKIKNLSVDTLDVSSSGYLRSGKTSFTDTTNAGWYLSSDGVFIGNAGNTKNIKYNISAGTFVMSGITLTWADVSGTGKPADNATVGANWTTNLSNIPQSATASYITSTKITATTIESPTITAGVITGATVQSSSSPNTGVKMTNSGLIIFGQSSFNFETIGGLQGGYIGAGTSQELDVYNQYGIITVKTASGGLEFGGNIISNLSIIPSSSNVYSLGQISNWWRGIFGTTIYVGTDSGYGNILYSSSRVRISTDTQIQGTLYASGAIECSTARIRVGTTDFYPTTGAYNASAYYLRS